MHQRRYSLVEESANAWTHRFAYILSAVTLAVFAGQAAAVGPAALCGALVFGLSLTTLFFISTAYHAYPVQRNPRTKLLLRKLDHAAIYVVIAATHVACMLLMRDVPFNVPLFSLVAGLSFIGVVVRMCSDRSIELLSLTLYLTLGWLGVFVFGVDRLFAPDLKVGLMMAGGLVYTAGVIFYIKDRLPYFHAVWHLFVVAASALHYAALFVAVAEYTA